MSPVNAGGATTAPDPGFGFLAWAVSGRPTAGSTWYLTPFGYDAPAARTERMQQWEVTRDASLFRFYAHMNIAPVGVMSHVATIRINGIDTALALTLDVSGGRNVADLVTQVVVSEGDLLSLELATAAGNAADTLNNATFSLGLW